MPTQGTSEFRRIQALEKARARRVARATDASKRTEWFINEVSENVRMSMRQRVRLATEFVKNKAIRNVSRPVTKHVKRRLVLIEVEEKLDKWQQRARAEEENRAYRKAKEQRALPPERKKKYKKKWVSTIFVTDRSKKGEYPKADTIQMMKSIFSDYKDTKGIVDGFVGISLDYPVILELSKRLDRKWLSRTLNEERSKVISILTGPLKVGGSK